MPRLNQIVAIEKGVKSRVYGRVTTLHKTSQRGDAYAGFAKNFRRRDEDGVDYPPERKVVQLVGEDVLRQLAALQTELFDVTFTKDSANCAAKADVVVDGRVLIRDAPVTFLLFLEKQLSDMRTFVAKLPTLDPSEDWSADPNSDLFRTTPASTHKTKKVQRPIVLYDATEEHPAQTQLISEDVVVGWWDTVKHSGALPVPRKKAIQARLDKLVKAVKFAREEANSAEVEEHNIGEAFFDYLFEK